MFFFSLKKWLNHPISITILIVATLAKNQINVKKWLFEIQNALSSENPNQIANVEKLSQLNMYPAAKINS